MPPVTDNGEHDSACHLHSSCRDDKESANSSQIAQSKLLGIISKNLGIEGGLFQDEEDKKNVLEVLTPFF